MCKVTQKNGHWARFGPWYYGFLFAVALPLGLAFWCSRLDLGLPALKSAEVGTIALLTGLSLMAGAALDLWQRGRGLPMNAFPPSKLVTEGLYKILPHPIYFGFVLAAAGLSLALGSAAGLWLGTPLAALVCLAIVIGYEKPYLLAAFGTLPQPFLGPPPLDSPLTFSRRLGTAAAVLLPWLLSYNLFKALGLPPDVKAANFAFEAGWPVLTWTYPVYASAYIIIPLSFFLVREARDLRDYFRSGWLAIGLTSLIYLLWPLTAPTRDFPVEGLWAGLLALDIRLDQPPVCACPSYHVIWAVLAAYYVGRGRSRLFQTLAWLWAAAIALTCLSTSFHALIDVICGLALAAGIIRAPALWAAWLKGAEKLANSWRAATFQGGRVRIINHALPAALAGGSSLAAASLLAGPGQAPALFALGLVMVLGSGLWGQWLEGGREIEAVPGRSVPAGASCGETEPHAEQGSSRLQRPFGYFGGLFGFGLGLWFLDFLGGQAWLLAGAALASAPLMQALGRLRCLIQGCCHGRPVRPGHLGIMVTNPHSRVSAVSGLRGQALYPTQVYSILGNLIILALLWRLWSLAAPLSLVAGLYLILAGLARFMEEAWRGETQTAKKMGLAVYQWLSILMVASGFVVSALPSPPCPPPAGGHWPQALAWALPYGLICGAALGLDWPKSRLRFARLSD